jgi:putative CocE/NonD family hydrolase
MKTVDTFPRDVQVIENQWITMSDGVRLAARMWMPEDAEDNPVPAILELIPYRKRDGYRRSDDQMHGYFAGHGYVCMRVDIRGSGDSDGLLVDEYVVQEQEDALEIIAWAAAQSWCNGKVGMTGISWGGFNSLQVAARRPPALGAIITSCSTDDRYADDIHYMGGCTLENNFSWGATMYARLATPPDPDVVGDGWRETWLNRLENLPFFTAEWHSHQRRDDFWKHGSVCENYDAIQCPVFAIGGWGDAYTNSIPRLLEGLSVPRIGVIGAWGHKFGHDGVPGPAIGFLQEALRWWDQWLKGADTGIMDEPMLRTWMQDSVAPAAAYGERPGRWIAEPTWPPADGITPRHLALNPTGLGDEAGAETSLTLASPQDIGTASGAWCSYGNGDDLPTDQRHDDADSLTFDTLPLADAVEILGAPVVTLEFAVDKPLAMVAVRLNDVAPDGSSLRVSYGLQNLTHRDGHETPDVLEPGKRYRIEVRISDVAHAFAPGHRVRVALSTGYWPTALPLPEAVTMTVFTGASSLALPLRASRPEDAAVAFEAPEQAPSYESTVIEPGMNERTVSHDFASGVTEVVRTGNSDLTYVDEIDLVFGSWRREATRINRDDPLSYECEITYDFAYRRDGWDVRTETRATTQVTHDEFIFHTDLDAYENGERIFSNSVTRRVPRNFG